jgi:hypothetical protein
MISFLQYNNFWICFDGILYLYLIFISILCPPVDRTPRCCHQKGKIGLEFLMIIILSLNLYVLILKSPSPDSIGDSICSLVCIFCACSLQWVHRKLKLIGNAQFRLWWAGVWKKVFSNFRIMSTLWKTGKGEK